SARFQGANRDWSGRRDLLASGVVRLSILIPAYQEERTIVEVVRLVREVDVAPLGIEKELVIVDDGSRDRTAEEIARGAEGDPRVRLLRHQQNRGKGAAIRTALEAAT